MRFSIVFLAVVFALVTCGAVAEDKKTVNPALVRTITAKQPVKLEDAVADFVIDLIHKNTAHVQDQYKKLTTATEAAAAGRYQTRRFEGIQWWVLEVSWEGDETQSTNTGEYIYLARQQLVAGAHRAYGTPVNVVAQVRVATKWSGKSDKGNVPDTTTMSRGTKITLTFEGFLKSIPLTAPEN